MAAMDDTRIYYELSGRNNGWTNVSEDVYVEGGIEWTRGIAGFTVTDRVSTPGILTYAMMNSADPESGRPEGFYTPGHVNARAGFEKSIGVKLVLVIAGNEVVELVGELRLIRVLPGVYGERLTACTVMDWLVHASRFRVNNIELQTNITDAAVFSLLTAAVPIQPRAIEVGTAFDTYPLALYNSKAESAFIAQEYQRLTMSSYSRILVKRDGTLTYEARNKRPQSTATPLALTQDNDLVEDGLEVDDDADDVLTTVQVKIHPPEQEVNVVLFVAQAAIKVEPGIPTIIRGLFTKPGQTAFRAGGLDMIDPVANTDYTANTLENGTGTDITGQLSIEANFSANSVQLIFTTSSAGIAYVRGPGSTAGIQVRGTGIYDRQDTVLEAVADVDATVPDNVLTIDMPYQADPAFGYEAALYQLHINSLSVRRARRATVTLSGADNATALSYAIREISDRVTITESMTALPRVSNESYFINQVKGIRNADGDIRLTFLLEVADPTSYWYLNVAGKSELDVTTVLGFGLVVGHTDVAHGDEHGDSAHTDTAHSDVAHGDSAHGDAGHGDAAHSDVAHSDTSHADAHDDVEHSDVAHTDSHADVAHVDGHGDSYVDFSDVEAGHVDHHHDTHSDVAHDDTHNDTAHDDVSHGDSHGDTAHSDVSHSDVSHSDQGHVDNGHVDGPAHSDVAHGDVEHADGHVDSEHGDAN